VLVGSLRGRSVAGWMLLAAACGPGDSLTGGGTGPVLDPSDWPEAWAAEEDEVLRLVNVNRTLGAMCADEPMGGGLPPLQMDDTLREVARAHSQDMAVRGFFDHVNPSGEDPFDRVAAAGFTGAEPWAENIAAGAPTAAVVVDGWMDSPGHCLNIMEPAFGVIGVGLYGGDASDYGTYWTQVFAGSH
jgi:uncharacterized protein YkwD